MTTPPRRPFTRSVLSLAIAALAGCAAAPPYPAQKDASPVTAPGAPIADFSDGLRCMDNLLLDHGAHDLSILVEDVAEPGRKPNAGAQTTVRSESCLEH
ncbi:MAG TPA: hypothetical protein VGQ23_12910 [Burkholderiaceae bacterium]|jgi:hypothetical protein|nr:hypothetical protein [Burkholderiaceae bacterium]